jgi:hypothetical protein
MKSTPTIKQFALLLAAAALLFLSGWTVRAQETDSDSEYVIKAGFIYNFAKFVEWPANTFSQPATPIVIGVFGSDRIAGILEQIVKDKKVDNHGFVVRRLKWAKDIKGCNILFLPAAEASHADDLVSQVKGTSILTIGEIPGFAKHGGIINFTLEDSKVRFEVNVDAAKQADLNISSRLLSLARIVQESIANVR